MKGTVAVVLCFAIPLAVFAADQQPSHKVIYDGGSLVSG